MVALVKYDAACRAIADARSVDEAQSIRNHAEALRAYARQAKNKQLEVDAAEIRIRAERRVGELMQAQRETVGLAKGARGNPGGQGAPVVRDEVGPAQIPTLAEAGIDKHLADRARKLAAVPAAEFEANVTEWRGRVEQENERVTTKLVAAGERELQSRNDPISVWEDEEVADRIATALRPVRKLAEEWPDGRSFSLFIHEVKQVVKFLERLESQRAELSA